MFPIKFGIWVDEKREFYVKIRLLTVLKIEYSCEVLENYFGTVKT